MCMSHNDKVPPKYAEFCIRFQFFTVLSLTSVKIRYQFFRGWRRETGLSRPVKYFTDRSKAVLPLWIIHVISGVCLLCFRVRLLIVALWSPAGKGLTSWLSFVMCFCKFVTFPLESWVRRDT